VAAVIFLVKVCRGINERPQGGAARKSGPNFRPNLGEKFFIFIFEKKKSPNRPKNCS
jgi:hypothetical protein